MEMQPLYKAILGGTLLAISQSLNLFGLFRSVDYVQKNYPTAFAVLDNAAFEKTLLYAGFGMCGWALYEIWKRKHRPSPSAPPTPDPQSPAPMGAITRGHGSHAINAPGGTVNIGPSAFAPTPAQMLHSGPEPILEFQRSTHIAEALVVVNIGDDDSAVMTATLLSMLRTFAILVLYGSAFA